MALADSNPSVAAVWPLNEASGNALETIGSLDLTDTNTVAAASSMRDFESTQSEYFTRASAAALVTGDIDFTVSTWINLESTGAAMRLMAKWNSTADREYMLSYTGVDFEWLCRNNGDTANVQTLAGITPASATLYNITAWHDSVNNVFGIAVNAGTAVTTSSTAGVRAGTANFMIGCRLNTGVATEFMDGLIGESVLWKTVLSAADRTELYNGGVMFRYPFFVPKAGYYQSHYRRMVIGALN